jgi:hypothetical protein
MGAVVLPDLDRCRRSRLHWHIGRNSGYRPLLFYVFVVIFLVLLILGLTIFRV